MILSGVFPRSVFFLEPPLVSPQNGRSSDIAPVHLSERSLFGLTCHSILPELRWRWPASSLSFRGDGHTELRKAVERWPGLRVQRFSVHDSRDLAGQIRSSPVPELSINPYKYLSSDATCEAMSFPISQGGCQ